MNKRRSRTLAAVTAVYAVLLAAASLLPSGGAGPLAGWDAAISPGLQNLLHVPAYAVLVFLTARAWAWPPQARPAAVLATAAGCAAFGALLEWAQSTIPGRTGSLSDILLNTAGAGAALVLMLGKRAGRKEKAADLQGDTGAHGPGTSR